MLSAQGEGVMGQHAFPEHEKGLPHSTLSSEPAALKPNPYLTVVIATTEISITIATRILIIMTVSKA